MERLILYWKLSRLDGIEGNPIYTYGKVTIIINYDFKFYFYKCLYKGKNNIYIF